MPSQAILPMQDADLYAAFRTNTNFSSGYVTSNSGASWPSMFSNPAAYTLQPPPVQGGGEAAPAVKKPGILDISPANEKCTDGKNDGKIGFFQGCLNFIKGMFKTLGSAAKNLFFDENNRFSPIKLLKSLAVAAGCTVCPPLGMAFAGYGVYQGGKQIFQGLSDALNAETDEEAKAAWQRTGGGTLITGSAVYAFDRHMKDWENFKDLKAEVDRLRNLEIGKDLDTQKYLADIRAELQGLQINPREALTNPNYRQELVSDVMGRLTPVVDTVTSDAAALYTEAADTVMNGAMTAVTGSAVSSGVTDLSLSADEALGRMH